MVLDKDIKPEWSIHLPLIQRILNASVHSALGVSPAQLLFGNAITLDRGIFLPRSEKDESQMSLSEWADKMLTKQQKLLQIVQNSQHAKDDYQLLTRILDAQSFQLTLTSWYSIASDHQLSFTLIGRDQ